MVTPVRTLLGSIAILAALPVAPVLAEWQPDGVPVCTAGGNQGGWAVVPVAGGAIVVWSDERAALTHVYAQRLDAAGVPQWSSDGVLVSDFAAVQGTPVVAVGDGAGGAIIAYVQSAQLGEPDGRVAGAGNPSQIYGQRINSSGVLVWGSAGILLCPTGRDQIQPAIISDNRNPAQQLPGAIVAWQERRSGLQYDIYAQKVDTFGTVGWSPDGVPVCTAAGDQTGPFLVTDGTGTAFGPKGAIVTWIDERSGNEDIYVQRLSAAGVPQWEANGRAVCTNPLDQRRPVAAFIGPGAAIIGWIDERNGGFDIYAQQESNSGAGWLVDGLPVCRAIGDQFNIAMIGGLDGGATFVWEDWRAEVNMSDIYAQRLNWMGTPLWAVDGAPVCTAPGLQGRPGVIGDAARGVICAWYDGRGVDLDIYAQRADTTGVAQWTPGGVLLCGAPDFQHTPLIVTDAAGGAIVAWTDARSGGGSLDVYANHISASGGVTGVDEAAPVAHLAVLGAFPNPSAGATAIRFTLPGSRTVTARVFGPHGRVVRTLAEGRTFPAGPATLRWDGRDLANRRVPSGIYFVRVDMGGEEAVRSVSILR